MAAKKTQIKKVAKQAQHSKASKSDLKRPGVFDKLKISLAVIIALTGFFIYINSIGNHYTLDDASAITENRIVKQGLAGIPELLRTSYRHGYWSNPDELYRPLSLVMFAVEWHFFPDSPQLYHLINILLYGFTGFMLFLVLYELFNKQNLMVPFLTGMLFITHPIHTEVVASIKSRDEILSFLLLLGTLWFLIAYLKKRPVSTLLLSLFCFFLSLLAKESSITYIAIIPLLLYFFIGTKLRKNIYTSVLFLIPIVLYLFIRTKVLGDITGDKAIAFVDNILVNAPDTGTRTATAFYILGKYLLKMIFPHPLVYDYSYNAIEMLTWSNYHAILSLLAYLTLGVLALCFLPSKNKLAAGIFLYLIPLSLFSNLVLLIGSNMAERFLYVPSLGFCFSLAWLTYLYAGNKSAIHSRQSLQEFLKQNRKLLIPFALLILIYSGKTISRNPDWKDNYTLYSHDVKTSPNSARIHYNVGLTIIKDLAEKEQQQEKKDSLLSAGIRELEKAVSIYPNYADPYTQLGVAYYRKKNYAKAIKYDLQALKHNPGDATALSNLGSSYFELREYNKALEAYQKAVQADPNHADAYLNMGSTYGTLQDFDKAITCFLKVIELEPKNDQAYDFLSMTYNYKGDKNNALLYKNKANQLRMKK